MTILEFVEKVRKTFEFKGEVDVKIYHKEYREFTLTYSELMSDVSNYSNWEIQTYKSGSVEITFTKEEE